MKNENYDELKEKITKAMKECTNKQGVLNVTEFRNKYRKEYSKIPVCFGDIESAMKNANIKKMVSGKNNPSLNTKLALDYLNLLSEQGVNLASIARKYGVSRANVSQLYKYMKKVVETTSTPA
jgi:predicted DNA-binding protein YlxM (UPF0122 family)